MFEIGGVWLPDGEEHLKMFAKGQNWRYQGEKMDKALTFCKQFRVAIDVGGHCGLWSKELIKHFQRVVAFEPMERHRECYMKNVSERFELHHCALGDKDAVVMMKVNPNSSGDTRVHKDGTVQVEVRRLDDIYQGVCDFLKIDTEGYEEFVLRGAERILEQRPVVIVEQKRGKAQEYGLEETGAVSFLKSKGYKQKDVIAGDYIMVHE